MSKDFSRKRVLDLIGEAWDKCPELRLGQLIVNSAARCTATPLFYAEDMELAVAVEEFTKWLSASLIPRKEELTCDKSKEPPCHLEPSIDLCKKCPLDVKVQDCEKEGLQK